MRDLHHFARRFFRGLVFTLLSTQSVSAEPAQDELRICAARNEPPYSIQDGTGFENRLAVVLAEAMGRKPVFVWSERPAIYLVHDLLDKKACDIVMGLDTGDQRVLTSDPYYRSAYVFLSRADSNFDVESWNDEKIRQTDHIVVPFGSPGEVMLKEIGKYEDNMAYLYSLVNFRSSRNQYTQIPPSRLVSEVVDGNAELAVVFAPDIARYVKSSSAPLRMTIIKNDYTRDDGTHISFQFDQSIGVRKEDPLLLQAVNEGLEKARGSILKILNDEGVPLVHKST